MERQSVIYIHLEDASGLDAVRKAAWVAFHRKAPLEIVVGYRPPHQRTLARWRAGTPGELRWRVTGSVCAEGLADAADAVARRQGVAARIRMEELPRRRWSRLWFGGPAAGLSASGGWIRP